MNEETETQNPSGLTNAEIDQLMAPVIVRVSRRARQYVWVFASVSLAMAVVLIPVLRVGASASLDLTIVSLLFVAAPPALIARAYALSNIPRARKILERGTVVLAVVEKARNVRNRSRFTVEWLQHNTNRHAHIEVEHIDAVGTVKAVFLGNQKWVCILLGGRVFIARRWEFRRDL